MQSTRDINCVKSLTVRGEEGARWEGSFGGLVSQLTSLSGRAMYPSRLVAIKTRPVQVLGDILGYFEGC